MVLLNKKELYYEYSYYNTANLANAQGKMSTRENASFPSPPTPSRRLEQVEIPWGHLGSKPVKVFLQGVCVLVSPVDKDSWGDDEVRARRLGIKRELLEKAEARAKKSKEGKGDEHQVGGYIWRGEQKDRLVFKEIALS